MAFLVEVVLDTGQRLLSEDLPDARRADVVVADMRARLRVVAVSRIDLSTGECLQRPSWNLSAGQAVNQDYRIERRILDEALGRG